MKDPVTIVQIAKESGVSIATVSRVMNGTAPVADATKEKVNAVIAKYRYTPNVMARSLIKRTTMTIGIIIPDITNPYFAAMFRGFETAAREAGYSVFLCNTDFFSASDKKDDTPSELQYFDMMIDRKVDGVLIVGGQADLVEPNEQYRLALRQLSSNVPVVVLGSQIDDIEECRFLQRESGRGVGFAVEYLYSLGHRRIAFVGGENGVNITESRLRAYRDSLNALGLPYDPDLIATSDYYTADGYRAMKQLLLSRVDFTAFLAVNDAVAIGAYRALADAGLSVPKDVSVISCDQFFNSEYLVPRLSSIDHNNEQFSRKVIEALLARIRGEDDPPKISGSPELIIRESCTAPGV